MPCRHCGAMHRTFEVGLSADVVVGAPPAIASAHAPAPTVEITPSMERILDGLADLRISLRWLQLSPSGAWLVQVVDQAGNLIDMAAADDPQDALLSVAERLLPQ